MKKLMTLALGLSFLTGSSLFAGARPVDRGRARNEAKNDKRRQDDHRDRRAPLRGHPDPRAKR